jgi:hypothetical protein
LSLIVSASSARMSLARMWESISWKNSTGNYTSNF